MVAVETPDSYQVEEDALEAAFSLEDQLQNPRSAEFSELKKDCDNFVALLKPTVVRLRKDNEKKIRGLVEAKIRCRR